MHLNWTGLIPIIGGAFATLQGMGVFKSKKHADWQESHRAKNGPMLKTLGPIIVAFGILQLFRFI